MSVIKNYISIAVFILLLLTLNSYSQKIVWKPKANIPKANCMGDLTIKDSTIYLIGGREYIGDSKVNYNFAYNIITDTWETQSTMPTGRWNLAVEIIDTMIFAIGGDPFLDKNEMYNIITEEWITLSPLPTPRQHVHSAVVEGKIYVIGGLESWSKLSSKNEMYDPVTNTWEEKSSMPTPRQNMRLVAIDTLIYVLGGAGDESSIWTCLNTVEVYNTKKDTWNTATKMPYSCFVPQIAKVDNKIFVVGGDTTNAIETNIVSCFDTKTNKWTLLKPFYKNISFGCMTSYQDKLFLMGGCYRKNGSISQGGIYNNVYEGTIIDSGNFSPELYYPLQDTSCFTSSSFMYIIPYFTFIDDDTLSYSASLVSGDTLPAWLTFNANKKQFLGTPTQTDTLEIIVKVVDNHNAAVSDTFFLKVLKDPSGIDIKEEKSLLPNNIKFNQNYPNPFNLLTKIEYSIPVSDFVTLKIYDILGREIEILVNEFQETGEYSINFGASNLSCGIYFYRLQIGKNFVDTKRMLLLR